MQPFRIEPSAFKVTMYLVSLMKS